MTFQVLRIVLLYCHYWPCAKMSMSGKYEISSGNCQGNLFPSDRGNPELKIVCFNDLCLGHTNYQL